MTGPDRTKAERALAFLVAQLRPDWGEPGVLSALRKVSDKPLPVVVAAALDCATNRADQHTPAVIAADGAHWTALDRLNPRTDTPRPSPVIVTYCEHGAPGSSCPECFPRGSRGAVRTPEQRALVAQAAAEARAELARADKGPTIPQPAERTEA